ncbi:EF-hand domain-containing family member B [Drosophila bipectinata]|uniref:EF-hand domain-containing family member B n=1 Tax=Drosophila bipectinata TaxID=42026 RepID=UPI001C8A690C|nr:EF-hand domain-containing family member B [Drosophila bipectinata]
MANVGHFTDRNKDIRAAGLSSSGLIGNGAKDCLIFNHSEELAEHLVRADCAQKHPRPEGPRTPIKPDSSLKDLLTSELRKSRFVSFKEKFYEELYFKKPIVGEVKPAYTKPDSVTNLSQTFGRPSNSTDSLYSLIMPVKSAEEVNREYGEFHDKHIVSHNHYFPAEQIRRNYKKPFDPSDIFGDCHQALDTGLNVKHCLVEGENHLKVIGKAQVDFMNRTEAPLGKKFKSYPSEVPDMVFGRPNQSNGSVKMLIDNVVPCESANFLMAAIRYLKTLRQGLRKRSDFHMRILYTALERQDLDQTGQLPLDRILETLQKFNVRVDARKFRILISHFRMFVDEGCATERLSYEDFCRLLSIQDPLPQGACLSTLANGNSLKDTTYRLLCADRHKTPNPVRVNVTTPEKLEAGNTHVKDLIAPEVGTLRGLGPMDFECLRSKSQIQQIFRSLISEETFQVVWQQLMAKEQDQEKDQVASVNQFRDQMHIFEAETSDKLV